MEDLNEEADLLSARTACMDFAAASASMEPSEKSIADDDADVDPRGV